MSREFRIIAGLIGMLGLSTLIVQTGINVARAGGLAQLGAVLWSMGRFFTILTNALVAGSFLVIAVTGRRLPFGWMSMLTMSMLMVAGVYHLVLASAITHLGLRWWTDQSLHTLIPAMVLWFWLMETARNDPRGGQPVVWLAWPALYAAYALLRGALTGRYPYPFLNAQRLEPLELLANIGLLLAAFATLALVLNHVGQRMPLRRA